MNSLSPLSFPHSVAQLKNSQKEKKAFKHIFIIASSIGSKNIILTIAKHKSQSQSIKNQAFNHHHHLTSLIFLLDKKCV